MFLVQTIPISGRPCFHLITSVRKEAEDKFMEMAVGFYDQSFNDRDALLDNGYVETTGGTLYLWDLSNTPGYQTSSRVAVYVEGGILQEIWADGGVGITQIDMDNIKSGDAYSFDVNNIDESLHRPDASFDDFLQSRDLAEALRRSAENQEPVGEDK